LYSLQAFYADSVKGRKKGLFKLVVTESIGIHFVGLENCHIESVFRDYRFSLNNYPFVLRSHYFLNYAMESCTVVVIGVLKA